VKLRSIAIVVLVSTIGIWAAKATSKGATDSKIVARYQDLPVAPLVWNPPKLSDFADTLKPGVVVYWVTDNSLPLASVNFIWPEGSLGLGGKEEVAADLLGSLLRRGGAGKFSARQVDDTLEFLAASASVGVGRVRTTGAVGGLSRDLPFLIDLLGDMLVSPRLDTARFSVVKSETLQGVAHRFDSPAQMMALAWDRVSYGPSHWTHLTDSVALEKLQVSDVRNALQNRFSPQKVWISVAGQVDRPIIRQKLLALLERLEKSPWRKSPKAPQSVPVALPELPQRGTYIADIPATQVELRIGTRFVKRDHPDYYPLMLASYVLGQGGFGSRLVDRVRSDEGLAYHVSSFAGSDYDRPAMLGVTLQTKTQSTGRAIQLVFEEISRLRDSGFRVGELEKARKGLAASVPSLFDTPENTADLLLQSAAWGRNNEHFGMYLRALDTIPDARVLEVFRQWFVPDSMRIVIAGPAEELRKPFADGAPSLTKYGPLFDLSIPVLREEKPLAPF
jgi:zinc protease